MNTKYGIGDIVILKSDITNYDVFEETGEMCVKTSQSDGYDTFKYSEELGHHIDKSVEPYTVTYPAEITGIRECDRATNGISYHCRNSLSIHNGYGWQGASEDDIVGLYKGIDERIDDIVRDTEEEMNTGHAYGDIKLRDLVYVLAEDFVLRDSEFGVLIAEIHLDNEMPINTVNLLSERILDSDVFRIENDELGVAVYIRYTGELSEDE